MTTAKRDTYTPQTLLQVAVNGALGTHPETINAAPHETWMVRLRPSNSTERAALLDASAYGDLVK